VTLNSDSREGVSMVSDILGAALNWLHVFSAIGWLGASLTFGMVLGPILPGLTAGSRGELLLKLLPRFKRYIMIFGASTVVFGAAFAFALADGDMSAFSPANPWGLRIDIGAIIALGTLALAFFFVIPAMSKVVKLVTEMKASPGSTPSPLIPGLMKRIRIGATAGMLLLILVLVFMVAAAWAPTP
jgi:uncharacterized membrane protein